MKALPDIGRKVVYDDKCKEKDVEEWCEPGMSQPPRDLPPPSSLTKCKYNKLSQLTKRIKIMLR
jgi:hypothetical protein